MDLLLQQTPPLATAVAAGLARWLAVLAAAVGFWRIRSIGAQKASTASIETVHHSPPPPPSADLPALSATSSLLSDYCSGTPKARFTSYYSFDEDDGCRGHNEVMAEFEKEEVVMVSSEVIGVTVAWKEEVDRMIYSRSWDLGWYRCQKRAAINGNVVKYWAAAGDEPTSPRGMSFRPRF